ncbi:hypothetical protein NC651_025843 [Populus alba x Populus x berolinensis]|nr:hypothetical protein NC651_025843 [Populus alba x Populus x berolinensis]
MIPFPRVQGFPEGCGNTNHLPSPDLSFPFYYAAKQLRQPFEDVLKDMYNSDSSTPICVTSDMFLPWTLDNSLRGLFGAFESLHQREAKAWLLDPLLLLGHIKQDLMNSGPHNDQKQSSPHIKWLDHEMEEVGPGNVIYVAFGSQSHTTDVQTEEIALVLEKAGQPLIWVVRSSTWIPPVGWEGS